MKCLSEEYRIALRASGEYMMNHIEEVMEMVQDAQARDEKGIFNEKTLISVEVEVKSIARILTQQASASLIESLAINSVAHLECDETLPFEQEPDQQSQYAERSKVLRPYLISLHVKDKKWFGVSMTLKGGIS